MSVNDVLSSGGNTARGFESIADAIMYRWSVERDTWVSTIEVEQARDYLERSGMAEASPELREARRQFEHDFP